MDVRMKPFVSTDELVEENNMQTGDDVLTSLPEDIKTHIITLMPIKDSVRTSILSKKWEHMYKYMNSLHFDEDLPYHHKGRRVHFIDFVYTVLMASECKSMDSFGLNCSRFVHPRHVETWITTAIKRRVEDLDINYRNQNMVLPVCFLKYKGFRKLELKGIMKFNLPPVLSYPNLTTLHLTRVWFRNEETSLKREIVLDLPALRVFRSFYCVWHHVKVIKIIANLLVECNVTCSMYTCQCCGFYNCKIEMFGSQELVARGFMIENFVIERPELVTQAEFSHHFEYSPGVIMRVAEILSRFSNLTTLKLSTDIIEASTRTQPAVSFPLMDKVRSLMIFFGHQKFTWCGALMQLLRSVPKVEHIYFNVPKVEHIYFDVYDEFWNVDINQDAIFETPSCISTSLLSVRFECFAASESEIRLLKVFLKYGLLMQKVFLETSNSNKPLLEYEFGPLATTSEESSVLFVNFIKDKRKRKA